jgi:Fur family ferric uptake transcriptional regulator
MKKVRVGKKGVAEIAWRVTGIRTAIMNVLSATSQPLSAKEIGEQLRHEKLTANKTTIYRDLALFLKEGVITETGFGDDIRRYELTAKGHHHHLICRTCDKVEDVTLGRELEAEEERILKNKNFKILEHSLEFYGLCGTCRTK